MSSRRISSGDSTPHRRTRVRREGVAKSSGDSTSPSEIAAAPVTGTGFENLDRDATQLVATLELALAEGRINALPPTAVQRLMAAICRAYRAQIDAGQDYLPLAERTAVAPTDVLITCGALLRAADLGVFELGVWHSFTGR